MNSSPRSRALGVCLRRVFGFMWVLLLVGGCTGLPIAQQSAAHVPPEEWAGRFSVKVLTEPTRHWSAAFLLSGSAMNGRLSIQTPTGQVLRELEWNADGAVLRGTNEPRIYDSVDALSKAEFGGEELPLADLFFWLQGQQGMHPKWKLERFDPVSRRAQVHRAAQGQSAGVELRLTWTADHLARQETPTE